MSALEQPAYDRSRLTPGIVHIGLGNFHRSHQAMYIDRVLALGKHPDWAICGVGLLPGDAGMRDALASQDYTYTLVERDADTLTGRTIGSITGMLLAADDAVAVLELMAAPGTRIVSLTITEGGYNIDRTTGAFDLANPAVQHDLAHPQSPATAFGFITEALRLRRDRGIAPFTVMSCDNLPGNGHVAQNAILTFAHAVDADVAAWIAANVTFPNGMVDRITPVTTDADRALVRDQFGIVDAWPVITEPFTQWVLEDTFCNGRPPYELVGVQMVTNVVPYELMKLRLLNATHQAMAYIGMLRGYTYVHEAVADAGIERFLRRNLAEARMTLPPVPGIDLDDYIEQMFIRFRNPAIADTLARLAVDASDRIPKFVLPAIRDSLAAGRSIDAGVDVVASWAWWLRDAETVTDALADDLIARARLLPDDVATFAQNTVVFGDLAADDRFLAAFAQAVAAMAEDVDAWLM